MTRTARSLGRSVWLAPALAGALAAALAGASAAHELRLRDADGRGGPQPPQLVVAQADDV
jgi:hypothetical protein